jgi:hypothetical protein
MAGPDDKAGQAPTFLRGVHYAYSRDDGHQVKGDRQNDGPID